MKPVLLFILLFCFSYEAEAQLYLSAGVDKRKEGGRYDSAKLGDTLFSTAIHDRYFNDYYSLGIIYKKDGFVLDASLGFVYNKYRLEGWRGGSSYWNHGSYSQSTHKHRSMDVKYTYAGPRVGISKAFFHKSIFNLLLGGFVQVELLASELETNHYDSIVESYHYSGYNPITGEYQTGSGSSSETNYERFDGLRMSQVHFSFGINISPRFKIKRFLIAANLGMGWNFEPRTFSNIHMDYNEDQSNYDKKIRVFTQVGLTIGYQIPGKD
jgi:hypothetical protein